MTPNEASPSPELVVDSSGVIEPAQGEHPVVFSPDNPPWAQPPWAGVLKSLILWIASVACLLFIPLILVLPYFIYLAFTNAGALQQDLMNDKTFLFLSILGVIPAHLMTFVIAYFVITSGRRYPFVKTLGLEWPRSLGSWAGLGISALIAIGLLGLGALITGIFGGEKTQLDLLIESSYRARVATVILAVLTGPFIEEVIYRGILYPALARVLGVIWSVVLVSILFAGVHVWQYKNNLAVIAVITLLSVSLTIVRAVTHRLLPSFVIHLVFNGIQSIILLLQPYFSKAEPITPPIQPGLHALSILLRPFL